MAAPSFNSSLSVLSLNVNGLRDSPKRAALLQWLHAVPSRSMLCVFKKFIMSWRLRVSSGSILRVFCLVYLLVPILLDLAGVLSCFGRLCPL